MDRRKWDPYKVLELTARRSDGMDCVGLNRNGKRCRWDIAEERFARVSSLIAQMETKAPSDVSPFLSELARFSLCKEWHQDQAGRVIAAWKSALKDATKEYERIEGYRSEIRALKRKLKQKKSVRQELSSQIEELQTRLQEERTISAEYTEACVEDVTTNLSTRLEKARSQLTASNKESENLRSLLLQERSESSTQLLTERQTAKKYKDNANARLANQSRTIEDLQSKFDAEGQLSLQRLKALDKVNIQQTNLLSETQMLQTQLNVQREESMKLGKELDKVTMEQTETLSTCEGLKAQLSTECQTSSKLRIALKQAGIGHELILEEFETARSKLAAGLLNVDQLRHELTTLKVDLASTHSALETTQVDFQTHRKTNDEEKAAAATRDAESAAEKARLLEHISQLEMKLSTSFLKTLMGKVLWFWNAVTSSLNGRKSGNPVGGMDAV